MDEREIYEFNFLPNWRHPKNNNKEYIKWDDNTTDDIMIKVIADHAKVKVYAVLATFIRLCEYANRNYPDGSIHHFCIECNDKLLQLKKGTTKRIIKALEDNELIKDSKLVTWNTLKVN